MFVARRTDCGRCLSIRFVQKWLSGYGQLSIESVEELSLAKEDMKALSVSFLESGLDYKAKLYVYIYIYIYRGTYAMIGRFLQESLRADVM
jgi:hypothetical protein